MKKGPARGTTGRRRGCRRADGRRGPRFRARGGTTADGLAAGSPGVLSGNLGQVPVRVPVNVCALTVNVVRALNSAFGNTCVNA
ncbi:chaplin [Streptomyces virginiae]